MLSTFARGAGPLIGVGVGAALTGASLLWPQATGPLTFYGGLGLVALGAVLWIVGRLGPKPKPAPRVTPTTSADVKVNGSGNTTATAGRDVHISNVTPTENAFATAPHLIWSGVRAMKLGAAYEVVVACHNVGQTALVRPDGTWVRSTVDVLGPPIPNTTPIRRRSRPIPRPSSSSSSTSKEPIRPGAFDLRMQCKETFPTPGSREVRWRVTYMDDDLERGYVTECSATVGFVLGQPRIIGLPALDSTKRKTRNDDYNDYMRETTVVHRTSSPLMNETRA